MRRTFTASVLVAVAAFAVAACGDDEPSTTPFEAVRSDVPESQRAALEDGDVTVSELEAGFERVVACMEDRGVDLLANNLTVKDRDVITEIGYDNGAGNERAEDECKQQHFVDIYDRYAVQNAPSPDEQRDLARRLVNCARDEGVDVSRFSEEEAAGAIQSNHPDVHMTCMSRLRSG